MLTETPVTVPIEAPSRVKPIDPRTLEAAQSLEAAADYIDLRGWTRKNMSVYGRSCALNAIVVTTKDKDSNVFHDAAEAFISVINVQSISAIPLWNDKVAENGKHVSRKLREAAASLLGR